MENNTQKDTASIRIVIAMRIARAVMGTTQEEMAALLGISKVTLARIETLESKMSAAAFMRAMEMCDNAGIQITPSTTGGGMQIYIEPRAIEFSKDWLVAPKRRRTDRKKTDQSSD